MFLDTEDGWVAVASIRRVKWAAGKRVLLTVGDDQIAADGESLKLALRETLVSSFPAEPETYALWPYIDPKGQFGRWRRKVLAWGVTASAEVVPITAGGPSDGEPSSLVPFVLHPDGTIDELNSAESWPDVGDWTEAVRGRLENERDRQRQQEGANDEA